jgi:hypothetical protein
MLPVRGAPELEPHHRALEEDLGFGRREFDPNDPPYGAVDSSALQIVSRPPDQIADVERAVIASGARLVTADGVCTGYDSESEEVQASVQDLVAALELRKIRSRIKARAENCIAEGRTHGGDVSFGLRRQKSGARGRSGVVVALEPDPGEQAAIARAKTLRREGSSLRAIASVLDAEGFATRTGAAWQAMTIKRMLAR